MAGVTKLPLVIYHAACRDGFAAAWAAQYVMAKAETYAAFYGQEPPYELAQGRDVYVLDFSYPRAQMRELICRSMKTVVCEHHKTAFSELSNLVEEMQFEGLRHAGDQVVFDLERSGAGIAWDKLVAKDPCWANGDGCGASIGHHRGCQYERPWPINYVEDRDLWRLALPHTREINAFLGAVPFEFEAWDALIRMPLEDARKAGVAIQMKQRQYAAEVGKNAIRFDFEGHTGVPLVNAPQCDVSELLEALLDRTQSPIAMAWWQRADGLFQYSLRSRGDLDVSALAKRHGGGGHQNAAGFQCARLVHL